MSVDTNKVIDYIAQGNLTIIIMTIIILALLAWIKYEKSIRNLFYFIKNLSNREARLERQKESNAMEIRANLFLDRINLKIAYIDTLKLSSDTGRDALYHYLIHTLLIVMQEDFIASYNAYREGKIKPELFCSYHNYHQKRIEEMKTKYEKIVKEKLESNGWDLEKITYVNLIFSQWAAPHIALLSELISTCQYAEGIIMAWWIFYYDVYTTLNKFSILVNGKITGLTFENLKIGKPSRRKSNG